MNYSEKIQASIRFTHLEPLDFHSCNNCASLHLDIDKGYFCPQHREVDFGDKLKLVMINDCTDFHTEGNDAVTSTFSRRNR